MTRLLHREDPYQLEFDAAVVARVEHGGRPAVVLDQTAFYAVSGGQPWDEGTLDGVRVLEVQYDGDQVVHVLERPVEAASVHGVVDAARRRDHRQQHHGQHLLSRAFVDTAGARTTSFHLGAEHCTIDLDRGVDAAAVAAAEGRVNAVVQEARPVSVRVTTRAEAEALGAKVPPEAGDAVRLVDVAGYDVQPCSGTHPRNTAEVGAVLILGTERHKSGARVAFVCGDRALAAWGARRAVLDRLGALLSVPPSGMAEAVERQAAQLTEALRRARQLQEQVLEADASALAAALDRGPVVARRDGWSPADLRALAVKTVQGRAGAAFLGAVTEGRAHLAFAQRGTAHDMGRVLREAVALLGGRGGGTADVAQGGGDKVEELDAALALAARAGGGA